MNNWKKLEDFYTWSELANFFLEEEKLREIRQLISTLQQTTMPDDCLHLVQDCLLEIVYGQYATSKPTAKMVLNAFDLQTSGINAYAQDELKKALWFLTRSIAAAPHLLPYASVLSESYAHRSKVLYQMGYFKEASEDAKHAMLHGYPSISLYKMHVLLSQCYGRLGDQDQEERHTTLAIELLKHRNYSDCRVKDLLEEAKVVEDSTATKQWTHWPDEPPPLSYGVNREAPSASSAVAIRVNNTDECHLIATRDIKIGDVLIVERPFAMVHSAKTKWTHCAHCLKPSCALIPCPNCDWAMFCSDLCLHNANMQYHLTECTAYTRFIAAEGNMDTVTLLMLRTLIIASNGDPRNFIDLQKDYLSQLRAGRTRGFNSEGLYLSNDVNSVLAFPFQLNEMLGVDILNTMVFALLLTMCLDFPEHQRQTMAEYMGGLGLIVYQNMLPISETRFHQPSEILGGGLFPTFNLIKHSCTPNVCHTFHGDKVVVRALEPIVAGAQIVRCYGKPFYAEDRASRQSHLVEKYDFRCSCHACKNNWSLEENLPTSPYFTDWERHLQDSANELRGMVRATALVDVPDEYEAFAALMQPHVVALSKLVTLLRSHGKVVNQWYVEAKRDLEVLFKLQGNCSKN